MGLAIFCIVISLVWVATIRQVLLKWTAGFFAVTFLLIALSGSMLLDPFFALYWLGATMMANILYGLYVVKHSQLGKFDKGTFLLFILILVLKTVSEINHYPFQSQSRIIQALSLTIPLLISIKMLRKKEHSGMVKINSLYLLLYVPIIYNYLREVY
ncbi:MAG: hypothetical protein JKY52_09805 [Flavobacteriales bacterium]|nr:hypothetical protein [Flavobacteriales bacterium]